MQGRMSCQHLLERGHQRESRSGERLCIGGGLQQVRRAFLFAVLSGGVLKHRQLTLEEISVPCVVSPSISTFTTCSLPPSRRHSRGRTDV